jgi:hypothetical protein
MPKELVAITTRLLVGKGSGSICSVMWRPSQSKSRRGVVTPAVGRNMRWFIISIICRAS